MKIEFLQVLLLVGGLFFALRNRIDFLLLFFGSFLLYHWQIFYGEIWIPPFSEKVSPESVSIIFCVLVVLLAITVLHDLSTQPNQSAYSGKEEGDNIFVALILLLVSYITTIYSLYLAGDAIFLGKSEFARAEGLSYNFVTYYPAAMVFLYAVVSRKKVLIFLSLLPLCVYFFVGYRAIFATVLAGAAVIYFFNEKIFLRKNIKLGVAVILLFSIFALYKQVYIGLKSGDFFEQNYLSMRAEKDDKFDSVFQVVLWSMFSAEFGQISSNLSLTASQDLSEEYSFATAALGTVPGINRVHGITEDDKRFSRVIRRKANPSGASYGLGGTFWGEMYQAGGLAGVFLSALIIVSIIAGYNHAFSFSRNFFPMALMYISFLSFYIHRNDFVLVIGSLKNTIFLLSVAWMLIFLFRGRLQVPASVKNTLTQ